MHRSRFHATWIILLGALTACGSHDPMEIAALSPADLPTYGLGDSYQLSDGSSETVVAVDGDVVRWRGRDGSYITSRDIMLPRLAWRDASGGGERRMATGPSALFPLEAGKSAKFAATRTVRPLQGGQPISVAEDWRCDVAGSARVTTPAGDFDTWRVNCAMQERPPVTGTGLIHRTFYYAPAIGFYVRMEETLGGAPQRVVQLTGFTTAIPAMPSSALRQRSVELQRSLEKGLSGDQSTWTDPATGDSGDLTLVQTVRSERFGWCRDFTERIRAAGRLYRLRGTGCRNPSKIWDIVALAPNWSEGS